MALTVTALAGGVGGAKLVDGMAQVLPPEDLTVIVNTGDDFEHLGLHISPDLDTVLYTLARVEHEEQGWGRRDESWTAMATLRQLNGPTWFRLGDRDLGLHLFRTHCLREGNSLSEITAKVRDALGVEVEVLPMTDDRVATLVETPGGVLPFQTYFVAERYQPRALGFRFAGAESAQPAPGVLGALEGAELVVFCPSNPWVSLDPILALPGVRGAIAGRTALAVSPIVGGEALKGPAAKMYREMGKEPTALAVAQHFAPLLTGFVFDEVDSDLKESIAALGPVPRALQTIMRDRRDRKQLAEEILAFAQELKVEVTG